MTNNPKQPRGPGGKFVKAQRPAVFIDDGINMQTEQLVCKIEAIPQSNLDFMAGVKREIESPSTINDLMKPFFITVAAVMVFALMLMVLAIAWVW
jgi:hypothetical protein